MALSPEEHKDRMARKKAARDRMMEGRQGAKGLLIVHTGPGKGKSSAAFGMVLRQIGHDMRVGVIQFIKGAWDTAERRVLEALGEDKVVFKAMGEGFTWETQDRDRDVQAAARAWDESKKMIADPAFSMVVLDEINVALKYELIDLGDVIAAIAARPEGCHVVCTGRGAPDALIEAADLVTEMKLIKHPFKTGIKAQAGVEF